MIDAIRRMFQHMRWADEHALRSLREGAAKSADPSYVRALDTYAHIVAAEHVWLSRILQHAPRYPVWPTLSLKECEQLADDVHAGFAQLLANLDDSEMERMIHYKNSVGAEFDTRVSDILLHIPLHGSYHRGQVSLLVRAAGAQPAPTDYIALARGAPAATRSS